MTDVKAYIEQLRKSGRLAEMNVTGDVAGYDTPNAFGSDDEEQHAKDIAPVAQQFDFKYPTDKKKKNTVKLESTYKQMIGQLHEITYNDFKSTPDMSQKKIINKRIQEINRSIYEVERLVNQASKFRVETNMNTSHYWKQSKKSLQKIAERITKLSKKIIDLGA